MEKNVGSAFLILSGCETGRLKAQLNQSKCFTKAIDLVICD